MVKAFTFGTATFNSRLTDQVDVEQTSWVLRLANIPNFGNLVWLITSPGAHHPPGGYKMTVATI